MHARNGVLGVNRFAVEHICDALVGHELAVQWHLQFLNLAVCAENFAEMSLVYVLGELFDDNFAALGGRWRCGTARYALISRTRPATI
jgi:hypothetical protein